MASSSRRAAVLGHPVAHSLSPVLHRAAYAALGLDWTYDAIDCDEQSLAATVAERGNWAGFSCTMPLKRAVLDVADEVSTLAAAVGAGNTLLPIATGGWRAENTDVAGILATLRSFRIAMQTVTLLGAGGTAQAALAAFAGLGVHSCSVLVRDPARTAQLRASAAALGVRVEIGSLGADSAALSAGLVVSTLPRGGGDPLAGFAWTSAQVLLDVVYDPWPTALAGAVATAGGTVLSGGQMLLHQAAAQVELMTGRVAPLEAMRAALRAAAPAGGV